MCVSSRFCGFDSTRIRATELPTVPKPKMAMRNGRCAGATDASTGDAERPA